jgi:hypothetical protein
MSPLKCFFYCQFSVGFSVMMTLDVALGCRRASQPVSTPPCKRLVSYVEEFVALRHSTELLSASRLAQRCPGKSRTVVS